MKNIAFAVLAAACTLSGVATAQSTVEVRKDGEQMRPAQTVPAPAATGGVMKAQTAAEKEAAAMKEKGEQMMPKATGDNTARASGGMSKPMTAAEKAAAEVKERGEQMKPK